MKISHCYRDLPEKLAEYLTESSMPNLTYVNTDGGRKNIFLTPCRKHVLIAPMKSDPKDGSKGLYEVEITHLYYDFCWLHRAKAFGIWQKRKKRIIVFPKLSWRNIEREFNLYYNKTTELEDGLSVIYDPRGKHDFLAKTQIRKQVFHSRIQAMKCKLNLHDWSSNCAECSGCRLQRSIEHEWILSKCVRCGSPSPNWKFENRFEIIGHCPFCGADMPKDTHGLLHQWYANNSGALAMVSELSPRGYIDNTSLCRIGEVTSYYGKENYYDCEENLSVHQFIGMHKYSLFRSIAEYSNVNIGEVVVRLKRKYMEKHEASQWDDMGALIKFVPCDWSHKQADSCGSLDVALLSESLNKGSILKYPLNKKVKVRMRYDIRNGICGKTGNTSHPAHYDNGCGIYYIKNQHNRITSIGCALTEPIAEAIRKDLHRNLYDAQHTYYVPTITYESLDVVVTPRFFIALYHEFCRQCKVSARKDLFELEIKSDNVDLTLGNI